jgi:ABC-type multidrug transport system ATPase subunit
MLDASFTRRGETLVEPTTLRVAPGERVERTCAEGKTAEALAMMAAALLMPTAGTVLVGEYDPRVQPVHCKRIAAFVPHDPLPLSHIGPDRFIAYRAALWGIEIDRARTRARALLERLGGMHEAFAYPIVAAILPSPQVLVLDRPQRSDVDLIARVAEPAAVFAVYGDTR